MASQSVNDTPAFRQEILASQERCRSFGVDPTMTRNPLHVRLTPGELALRRERNKDFLEVATSHIQDLYRFVAGAGFAVSLADDEGYILDLIADQPILDKLSSGNCMPGFRWTERDVGTSALSIVHERRVPVQVNDDEHFCERGHGYTCSASPVFDDQNKFIGAIAMSGQVHQVHPHTLGMVITAAKAIQNQLRIAKTSQELLLRNNYMTAIIESIDSGVMAVDKNGIITQVNQKAKKILQWEDRIENQPVSAIIGSQQDWQTLMHTKSGYTDREVFVKGYRGVVQLLATAKPIFDSRSEIQGIIFVFQEINRIRSLVNKMAGSLARFTFEDIMGVSPAIQEAKRMAMLAAAGDSNVLLLGQTGTGKELFAQAIHNLSKRKHYPFVAINCGAIPRELLESELFGYVDGAFTGARRGGRPGKLELGHGGTIFLDEIVDMPVDMQVKLLRALQSGEISRIGQHRTMSVDLRFIAASHSDLKQEVERGNFREDLFYRLNVLPIPIPPLRDRPGDILLLARHILRRCAQRLDKSGIQFSPESEKAITLYDWPGNIRELENVIERAVNLVEGTRIEPNHFGPLIPSTGKSFSMEMEEKGRSLLENMERQTIADTLEQAGFNFSKASKILGISRATLYKKAKKYNIPIQR
jgi:transcriptional regulator with PAS, ATPase and Fis domain